MPGRSPLRPDEAIGRRQCDVCGYRGLALICWDVTPEAIGTAEAAGAEPTVVAWAWAFLADR